MNEIWRPVRGYEGWYEVSNTGKVRSVDRTITAKNGNSWFAKGVDLSPAICHKYELVNLKRGGQSAARRVHRLVLEAFVGPAPEGHECRHLDGNPRNNNLDNLQWSTHVVNVLDKRIHGTDQNGSKTHCPRGHRYEGRNIQWQLGGTRRLCRACNQARSYVRTHPHLALSEEADRRYAALMSEQAA